LLLTRAPPRASTPSSAAACRAGECMTHHSVGVQHSMCVACTGRCLRLISCVCMLGSSCAGCTHMFPSGPVLSPPCAAVQPCNRPHSKHAAKAAPVPAPAQQPIIIVNNPAAAAAQTAAPQVAAQPVQPVAAQPVVVVQPAAQPVVAAQPVTVTTK
jgi:hypothetical protein